MRKFGRNRKTQEDREKNELKKLTRLELLELMYDQSKELDSLRAELAQTKKKLADKEIIIAESGSIAEAALRINGVFQAAEAAAKQYLQNVTRMNEAHDEKE